MKSFLLLFLGIVAACSALAQTGQPVQAPIIVKRIGRTDIATTTFQTAYDSASNGDAIYLPGGIFTPPANFNKRLIIVGTGYNNDSSAAMTTTRLSGVFNGGVLIGAFFNLNSGCSGSIIVGVHFLNPIKFENNVNIIDFQRCKIDSIIIENSSGSVINVSESVIKAISPAPASACSRFDLNISNSVIEGLIDGSNVPPCGGVANNITIRNSILLGTQPFSLIKFNYVKIDKSIIFLKAGVTNPLLENVTSQNISNNLIISDNASRVNLSPSAAGNIIKNETFRNSVFISMFSDYHIQPTCTDCANKGVYSDGNGGIGNFRATAPLHIDKREIMIGSTNNRLRFKFTVKTSN